MVNLTSSLGTSHGHGKTAVAKAPAKKAAPAPKAKPAPAPKAAAKAPAKPAKAAPAPKAAKPSPKPAPAAKAAPVAHGKPAPVAVVKPTKERTRGENTYAAMQANRNPKSTVENPVATMWGICNDNIGAKRKDVIAKAVEAGISYYTARTQYQLWLTAFRNSNPGA